MITFEQFARDLQDFADRTHEQVSPDMPYFQAISNANYSAMLIGFKVLIENCNHLEERVKFLEENK